MDFLEVTPTMWALMILLAASAFTMLWYLDALTHKEIAKADISDKELTTHRILISTSILMEFALVGMYWSSFLFLPIFIAAFITRTAHEFIDELHFHVDRCSPRETALHLGMWLSVLIKTSAMFIWGFFSNYEGVESLPLLFYIWAILIFLVMSYTSFVEWNQKKT